MQFVIIGTDHQGALEVRKKARADHLEYWGAKGDAFLAAGPFLDANELPCGSMMIVEAKNIEEAQKMADNDPYVISGLFETCEVKRWNWLLGKPDLGSS